LLLAASVLACGSAEHDVRAETGIMVRMRDGVRLSTDLYFPVGAEGKLPAILWRSVYGKEGALEREAILSALVRHGYVVATQATRGRGGSEGSFVPSVGDRNDGFDTVAWLASQPWSNGKVGTAGCSSLGEAQLLTAVTRPPALVTVVPMTAASGYNVRGRPWMSFDGGAFELAQTAGWFSGDPARVDYSTLPVSAVLKKAGLAGTEYENFARSNPEGEYFRNLEWLREGESIDVPALYFDSWYDYGAAETLEFVTAMRRSAPSDRARGNQFAIISPGTHCSYMTPTAQTIAGERDLGRASLDVIDLQLRWYDYWIKGTPNGITDRPPIQYYVMGKNAWRSAEAWPVPGTRYVRLYLDSQGHANSRRGDGTLSFDAPSSPGTSDSFTYDPADPVPSLGGHTCCTGKNTEAGGYDQSTIEMRDDLLVYTSEPLEAGMEITGPLEVFLHVSSSAADTDFTAKLVDVYPDGRAFNIQEGALRMRYRDGFDENLRMRPGEVYPIRLDLHATSNYFGPGHRFRLEVSSSNFPRWDRNLNTGGNNHDESRWVEARNTVHHSAERPSYLVLPVVNSPEAR
jgi:predicted acyl esterase